MGFCGRTQRVIVYAGHPLRLHMEPEVAAASQAAAPAVAAAIIIIFLQVLRWSQWLVQWLPSELETG